MNSSSFSINVISDPSSALAPDSPMWNTDLTTYAEYDITLVKPPLLFADSVTLRTFRADMLSLVDADEFRFTIMPLRTVTRFLNLSINRDKDELEFIGIQESLLAPIAEARRVSQTAMRRTLAGKQSLSYLSKFAEKYDDSIRKVTRATAMRLDERRQALSTKVLDEAINAGILSVVGWGTDAPERGSEEWFTQRRFQASSTEEEYLFYGTARILHNLSADSSATMLEPGSRMFLSMLAEKDEELERRERFEPDSASSLTSVELAASVIGRLPGLDEFTIAEILDIRQDLDSHLPAFRAAMMDMADQVNNSTSQEPSDIVRKVDQVWNRKVSPALKDMEMYARRQGYPRQLLNVFSEDKGALASAISSIGLATGSLLAGAITLAPAALAASVPFIKAFNSYLHAHDALEQNKLYFLYQLNKRLDREG